MDPSFRRALTVYNGFLAAAVTAGAPLWLPWMLAAPKRRRNFLQRCGRGIGSVRRGEGAPVLWFHAVSVGEALAAAPLVRAARAAWPRATIYLSTVTVTGRDTARRSLGDAIDDHFFFPFDLPAVVEAFLRSVRPDAVVILETEIWPNFLAALSRRGTPALLVNGRLSGRSLAGYLRFRALFGGALATLRRVAAQGEGDGERYRALLGPALAGLVEVTGNMKFDAPLPDLRGSALAAWLSARGREGTRWVVAGSTHDGEEEALLDAWEGARRCDPSVRLVLAPRHPERFDAVARILDRRGIPWLRRSRAALSPGEERPAPAVLLLDTVGELAAAYGSASLAFVGGSLVPKGGHNILEPSLFGVPVVTGPHMENFREVEGLFREEQALVQVRDRGELSRTLSAWAREPELLAPAGKRARALLDRYRGATGRNLALLRQLLPAAGNPA